MKARLKNKTLITLEDFNGKYFGKRGCKKREEMEKGYVRFKFDNL